MLQTESLCCERNYHRMETFETGNDAADVGVISSPFDPKGKEAEEIDSKGIPSEQAFGRFQGRQITAGGTDFSGTTYRPGKRASFLPTQSEFESDVTEASLLQRFQRLQHEFKQFMLDVQQHQEAKKETSADVDLGELAKQMEFAYGNVVQSADALSQPPRVGKAFHGNLVDGSEKVKSKIEQAKTQESSVTYELHYSQGADKEKKRDEEEILKVEHRVAALEKQVGPMSSSDSGSLTDVVTRLESKVKLLNEGELRSLRAHLSQIISEIDRAKKSEGGANQQQAAKIDELYEMMKKREGTAAQIPVIATRLHALRALHERSAQMTQQVDTLAQGQSQVDALLKEDRELLLMLQASLKESSEAMDENIKSMRGRIEEFMQKQEK